LTVLGLYLFWFTGEELCQQYPEKIVDVQKERVVDLPTGVTQQHSRNLAKSYDALGLYFFWQIASQFTRNVLRDGVMTFTSIYFLRRRLLLNSSNEVK